MTLDEAIKHCEEKAKEQREKATAIARAKEPFYKYAECAECAKEHEQLAEWLKELKAYKERPQGKWISVSERLPKYSGLYLISIYDLVTVANFTGKYFCDRQMDKFIDVMAWQPLPKPYKKGGAE